MFVEINLFIAHNFFGNQDGRTALHFAAGKGNLDVIEKLLNNHNTDLIHAKDQNGWQGYIKHFHFILSIYIWKYKFLHVI